MEDLGGGAEGGGEEIELSLGLSIGGNSIKSPKLDQAEQKIGNADVDLNCLECTEPGGKREVQALRRQEAKRKREEKLRKRGMVTGSGSGEDNAGAEAQRVGIRARDRELRENEAKVEGPECDKREKNEENGENVGRGTVPVVPCPPLQFVPLAANGLVYPCVVPCLGATENEGGVLRPVACRGFWPGKGGLMRPGGDLAMGGSDSECKNGRDGTGTLRAELNRSPARGSSIASENQSSSQQGGSSSDSGSHSSHCNPDQTKLKYACKHGVASSQTEATHTNREATQNTGKAVPSVAIKSGPTELTIQTDSETQPNEGGSRKAACDKGLDAPSLSQMPCVSTTGNGPNGKTITGFLYRYTKMEVSIVCVCHGTSFSPAEFVEHAGGEDVTHPLRHITVIPSAFG